MNAKQLCILAIAVAAALAAIAPVAMASERGNAIAEARARGELRPAGEAAEPLAATRTGPSRTRAEVRAETLAARARGGLIAAGEAETPFAGPVAPSTLTRAEVMHEVLEARAEHALIPSGQGFGPVDPVQGMQRPSTVASFHLRRRSS
jgi:hypothetical protein